MADEKVKVGPEAVEASAAPSVKIDVSRRITRDPLWWGILAVYLLLFMSTGYLAFFGRDVNPALNPNADALAAKLNDEATKNFIMTTLKDEADEHKKKDGLALQSFNIVLGSLLGFLSASAVSRVSSKNET
ncbi:MAG TPA: hypothetical protein VE775_06080 [Pyrinomonadaceae bacterium]|nr:hypothetical protein [Pyrinomonadaceae bacterium]